MQLDKLRLDLRPRSNAQGLDLGFALLHAGGADVWRAWLALWLPLSALAILIGWHWETAFGWLLPWWLLPLLERAPLHVLARQVFGEQTGWRAALRAWPRELGGGWIRMLTWWRPFMAGRGLHQPVWVLERARGKTATARRATIARNGTGVAAFLFGASFFVLEFLVLALGILGLVGLFMSSTSPNPAAVFRIDDAALRSAIINAACCAALAIVGPIYTACTFTLYLNRRATLEAWDIEIVLRQLRPPARPVAARHVAAVLMAAPLLAMALLGMPPPVQAAPAAGATAAARDCEPPEGFKKEDSGRGPDQSPEQAAVRRQLEQVLAHEDLRGYRCSEQWELREQAEQEKPKQEQKAPPLVARWVAAILAGLFKAALIGGAIALVAWLLWRYGAPLRFNMGAAPEPRLATEIGGLDIREESLPSDVAGAVRALWQQGQQRAALALLYRATLSRLVSRQSLKLHHGATEGECLAQARSANAAGTLDGNSLALADQATTLWLNAAYGARWPAAETVAALCTRWQAHFDREAA